MASPGPLSHLQSVLLTAAWITFSKQKSCQFPGKYGRQKISSMTAKKQSAKCRMWDTGQDKRPGFSNKSMACKREKREERGLWWNQGDVRTINTVTKYYLWAECDSWFQPAKCIQTFWRKSGKSDHGVDISWRTTVNFVCTPLCSWSEGSIG